MVRDHLGYSHHEIVNYIIFGETRRDIKKTTLDFQRADFGLFKRLIWRVLWETALKNKKEILKVQEQAVHMD